MPNLSCLLFPFEIFFLSVKSNKTPQRMHGPVDVSTYMRVSVYLPQLSLTIRSCSSTVEAAPKPFDIGMGISEIWFRDIDYPVIFTPKLRYQYGRYQYRRYLSVSLMSPMLVLIPWILIIPICISGCYIPKFWSPNMLISNFSVIHNADIDPKAMDCPS